MKKIIFNDCGKQTDVGTKPEQVTVTVCCTVGPAHCWGTFSQPSTNDILVLGKAFEFQTRDTKLYYIRNRGNHDETSYGFWPLSDALWPHRIITAAVFPFSFGIDTVCINDLR
jgi:hypothetical protein